MCKLDTHCGRARHALHTYRGRARQAPCAHCVCTRQAPRARQTSITCTLDKHYVRAWQAPRKHQVYVGYRVGADGGWGLFWNIIYNYLNIPLCFLQTSWEWPVLLFKEGKGGRWLKEAPRGNHGTTFGVPWTHGWHSSTHTWAPRHVWCAPRDCNPALAQGHLSLVQRASYRSHETNAMVRWGTRRIASSSPWWLCMAQGRNALCTRKEEPWTQCHGSLLCWASWHDMGLHISVGKAHWCTRHQVSWLVHVAGSEGLDQRHVGRHPFTKGTLRGWGNLLRGLISSLTGKAWGGSS